MKKYLISNEDIKQMVIKELKNNCKGFLYDDKLYALDPKQFADSIITKLPKLDRESVQSIIDKNMYLAGNIVKTELLRLKGRIVDVNNKLENAWNEIEKVGMELTDIAKTLREIKVYELKIEEEKDND